LNTLEILAFVKDKVEDWALITNKMCGGSKSKDALDTSKKAYFDFVDLKDRIEKSLDEMTDGLLKQEQENNK